MELKNFVKEVVGTLGKDGAGEVSFRLHLSAEDKIVEVSPYGSEIDFKICIKGEKK